MATRKFLTSVADVYGYDVENEELVFTAKTLLDSSIEVSLGSSPVRGGRGNQLQYVYYHTGEMKFTLTDTQWNLAMLSSTVGSDINHTDSVYWEEEVTLGASGIATVTKTPLAFSGTTLYGWSTNSKGQTSVFTFTTGTKVSSTSLGTQNEVVCIRYYVGGLEMGEVNSFTIESNMVPKVVKLVMEAQLNSADVSTNKIGVVQVIAPRVTLSGAFTISMTSDGVSNTPLTGMALTYVDPAGTVGCATEPYYAKMIEIIDNSNWYDNVVDLAVDGGDFALAGTSGVKTLAITAIPDLGLAFPADNGDLSFAEHLSGTSGFTATSGVSIGLHTGIITTNAWAGTTGVTIDVVLTSDANISTSVVMTKTA